MLNKADFFKSLSNDNSRKIDCSNNELHGEDLTELTKILSQKPIIEELNLNYLSIGMAYINDLKRLLSSIKGLRFIHLRHNQLGNEGIRSLIEDPALKNIMRNVDIDFSTNQINDEGLKIAINAAKEDKFSPNSLLTITYGNYVYDSSLIKECESLAESYRKEKQVTPEEVDEKCSEQNIKQSELGAPGGYFFNEASTSRKSNSSSDTPNTSNTSTPPSEENQQLKQKDIPRRLS